MKDLHIHTKYSDGEFDEYEIIEKVKEAGINEFSICDHDTIEGSKKVYDILSNDDKVKFHSGVELSCRLNNFLNGIDVHLLVRDFDYDDRNLSELIDKISCFRKLKIQRMVDLVKQVYGVEISKEEIEKKEKTTNSFGKPHIYSLLKNYGEFDREEFYINMRKLKSDDLKLDAVEVITSLKNSKGYVTLAHPIEIMDEYEVDYDYIEKIVAFLASKGLDALETKHSKHTKENYKEFSRIAKKYNLKETEGSDYHGPNVKPNVKLGVCVKE